MSQAEILDNMFHFYSNLSEKRTKVLIARTKNEELSRRLSSAQSELLVARDEFIKTNKVAEQAQQMLNANHVKATSLKEAKRRKHDMVELLKQLSKEDYLPPQKRSFRESESMAKSFTKEALAAPWLPEKKELLIALDEDVMQLENIRNELKFMNDKIQERTDTINLHQRYPFSNFCIDVITYRRKSANIKQLLAREIHLNEEMKSKLPEKCNSIEESQDYLQSHLQTQSQQTRKSDDLEKSVLEHDQVEEICEIQPIEEMQPESPEKCTSIEEFNDFLEPQLQIQSQTLEDDDLEKSVPEQMEESSVVEEICPVEENQPVEEICETNLNADITEEADGTQTNFLNFSTHSQAGNTSQGAPGDFMSMLNMVNESENASGTAAPGGEFFDLFGGGGHDKSTAGGDADNGGKDSQESMGGMFNFNFGNSSVDDGPSAKKSFFDF